MNFQTILLAAAVSVAATGTAKAAVIEHTTLFAQSSLISYWGPLGQSFSVQEGGLDSIALSFLRMNNVAVSDVTISILDGLSGGNLIAQRTFTPVAGTNFANQVYTTIDFTGTSLDIGSTYYLTLTTTNNHWGVVNGRGTYEGGGYFQTSGGNITYPNTYDMNFRITTSPLAAVPEPASWAMLIMGFGLVGSALRRRTLATAA